MRGNDTNSGVPVLSRLPILGPLFGLKTADTARTELLVLLTPRVLYNREDARRITDDLRRGLQTLAASDSPDKSATADEGSPGTHNQPSP